MTMPALYEISENYMQALDFLTDPEQDFDLQTVEDTLEGIEGELTDKATNVIQFQKNLESTAAAIKEAEQAMAKRRKALENKAAGLKRYVQDNMIRTGIEVIECPYFKLSLRKSESIQIDDSKALPAEYLNRKITVTPDKTAIKKAIKDGHEVPGAHLQTNKNLQIR